MKLSLKELQALPEDIPPWEWPKEPGSALLDTLRNASATEEELLLAVELAGIVVVVNDELVGALLGILRNGQASEELRGDAAVALGPALELADTERASSDTGHFDDPDSVPITESTFHETQRALRALYLDASVPKLVRRRVLESSVRAPEKWHRDAIRAAYASDDEEWRLTAVFGMHFVRGFDQEILASLKTKNPDIHREAISAAGNWALGGAWRHVVDLVNGKKTEKGLLLAAIAAVGEIRPSEAPEVLGHLEDSDDPDIADAVLEATSMSEWGADDEGFEGDGDDPDLPN